MTNRHRQARLLHYHIIARGLLIAAIVGLAGYTCAAPPMDAQDALPTPAAHEVQQSDPTP